MTTQNKTTDSYKNRPLRHIRKNFDWAEYVGQFSTKHTADPKELRICCPKCGETDYKCYVNTERGLFNCFKCHFSSAKDDVISFVAIAEGISKPAAIKKLMSEMQFTTPSTDEVEALLEESMYGYTAPVEERQLRYIQSLPKEARPLLNPQNVDQAPFFAYLTARGLTLDEIVNLQVHYVPDYTALIYRTVQGKNKTAGNIGRRVMWPVYGGSGRLVSWVARTIEPAMEPKYLNKPDSDLNMTLWPYVPPYNKTAVLVEGILDCYAVRRLDKTSAYATFGKNVSSHQIASLLSWGTETVVLFWDKRDAKPDMSKAVETLKVLFPKVYVAAQENMPKGLDSGDTLRMPDGLSVIKDALKLIDVYSTEYIKWKIA